MKEEINNNIKQKILFYIKDNNFKSAENLILKALKKYSNSSYLLELLAHCQYNEGQYEDAIRSYNIILKTRNNIKKKLIKKLINFYKKYLRTIKV